MKLFYKIILGICVTSFCFSKEIPSFEEDSSLTIPIENTTVSNPYVKIGSSFLFHHIGFGNRVSYFERNQGNDYSLNFGICPMFEVGSLYFEYDYLMYKTKDPSKNSYPYSGFGIDAGVIGYNPSHLQPYLNPKFFFGSQNEKGGFYQISFNILPVAYLVEGFLSKYGPPPVEYIALGVLPIVDISFGF